MSTAAIALLALLLVKHYIFDFHWQPPRMLVGKGIYGNWDGIQHSLWQGFGTVVALCIVGNHLTDLPRWVLVLALADALIHYHVDYLKAHYGTKDATRTLFWKQLGLDQFAHYLTYVLVAFVALGGVA